MQTFACQCGATLFFGNRKCVACGCDAGWCDVCRRMTAVSGDGHCLGPGCGAAVAPCSNRLAYDVCNAFVPQSATGETIRCRSCQLTSVAPDAGDPQNVHRWRLLEAAKRRLLYDFQTVGYPDAQLTAAPPLTFRFLTDTPEKHVITGHADGVITINLAEADPVHRETARQQFGEPQRTLIGHMRHETGHFFWMREIEGQREDQSASVFGDHANPAYGDAMKAYYDHGPAADWPARFISKYASSHPWEDFAESFAFYLDMRSVLDTLRCQAPQLVGAGAGDLPTMLKSFQEAGVALNEVNRSLGLTDLVPEVVPPAVVAKLQFVHDLFQRHVAAT